MRNDGDSRSPGDGPGPGRGDELGDDKAELPRAAQRLGSRSGAAPVPPAQDDPDAPPTADELRAAAALREVLAATEAPRPEAQGAGPGLRPRATTEEARWLAAHLRLPSTDDSLGEVRARGLARAARETVVSRRAQVRSHGWRQLGRSLTGTGGLLLAAAALLVVSWGLLDQGLRLQRGLMRAVPRTTTALLLGESLKHQESPTARLDLMIQERLQQLRAAPLRAGSAVLASHRGPAAVMLAELPAAAQTVGVRR